MSETHLIEQAPSQMSGMEADEYDKSIHEYANETQREMDERAVNSMLNAGKQSNKTMESKRPSSKDMPRDIVSYINSNGINAIVKKSLNRVLRDNPDD